MEIKKTIVILYERALCENMANALKTQLTENYPDKYVIAISDDKYIKNDFAKLRRKLRKSFLRTFPSTELFFSKISRFLFRLRLKKQRRMIKSDHALVPANKAKRLLNGHLKYVQNVFLRYDPEIIICTTPYCLKMALSTKSLIASAALVTAFVPEVCLDEKFVDYNCDGYYVLNNETRASLMKLGVSETRIITSGYPPCPPMPDGAAVKNKLRLNSDCPTVLLSGGEYEKQHLFPFFTGLTDSCARFNLVIDAHGINVKKLKKACELCVAREHVFIVNDCTFPELLSACDILITTPETDRLFLAFGYVKPAIVTPAQTLFQQKVVGYMDERQIAVIAETPEQFSKMLLEKLEELDDMKNMAKRAADLLINDVGQYRLGTPSKLPYQMNSNFIELTDGK